MFGLRGRGLEHMLTYNCPANFVDELKQKTPDPELKCQASTLRNKPGTSGPEAIVSGFGGETCQ